MKRRTILRFALGIFLVVVALLGSLQLVARQRFLTRGNEAAAPSLVANTEIPFTCVNVSLEQYTGPQLALTLDSIAAGGFGWVRQRFPWAEIEPSLGDWQWESWDTLVTEAAGYDLQMLAVLDTAPEWAGMPPDPAAFAEFAGAFATRYGDSLTYYQIWHNPNLGAAWGGYADAYGYVELLSQAAEAIRSIDPDARIVLGSLAPNAEQGNRNYAEDIFLEMLYVAGAEPYFDIVGVQPYGFDVAPYDRTTNRETMNFSRAVLVREVLLAHNDGDKAIWASHFGWNHKPESWPGPASIWGNVSETQQAEYTIAALTRAQAEWPWMGMMCINSFQPRPSTVAQDVPDAEEHWGFALVGPDGTPKPVYEALRTWHARPVSAQPGVYNAGTDLADFEGTWTLGPQGADIGQSGDRVSLTFEGTGVALTVRRGPYRAFLLVTVDGEPAPSLPRDETGRAYVVLYDPLAAVATVPLAENLPYGVHTVTVVADRGWGQWALAEWHVFNQPDLHSYHGGLLIFVLLGLLGFTLAIIAGWQMDWGQVGRMLHTLWSRLGDGVQWVIAVILSAIYIFASWQTIGQDIFRRLGEGGGLLAVALAAGTFYLSPWLKLTLLAGAFVALIVILRPDLGLALTMFAVPLYMHPLSLLGKSFSLAELVLLPTLVGWVVALAPGDRGWKHLKGGGWAQLRTESLGALLRRARCWLRETLRSPFFYFLVIAVVSTLFAAHRREALRELRLVIVEPLLFYLALTTLPLDRRSRWRILDAFVLGALLVAGVGLVQYFQGDVITAEGGVRRLRSIYGSPNNVGLYMGRVLPLLIALVLWGGEWSLRSFRDLSNRRLLYALAAIPTGLALLLSLSRGALILGIPAACVVMGILAGKRWRRVTLGLVVLGILALIPLLQTPRFAGLLDPSSGSAGFRLALWRSSWSLIQDYPLLGVGPDNFLYAYRTRYVLPSAWEEFNLSHP
ncbi:MAG: O-antigen ligase family protein, partial [Anaerolineae bacterium]|nr:O-antigen ligase family protein [Anaerolineae bacterium]